MDSGIEEEIEDHCEPRTAPKPGYVTAAPNTIRGRAPSANAGKVTDKRAASVQCSQGDSVYEDEYEDDEDFSDTFGLPVSLPSTYKRRSTSARRSENGDNAMKGSLYEGSRMSFASGGMSESGETSGRDTVYITRLPRTEKLLSSANLNKTASLSTTSSSISKETATTKRVWHRAYLNELAYNLTAKEKAAQKEELQRKLKAKADKSRPKSAGFHGEGGGGGDFLDRLEAQTRRIIDARITTKERADYDAMADKKICPSCGKEQSFDEYRKNIKKCQRDTCRGTAFRPKQVWSTVSEKFLGRLDTFVHTRDAHVKKALKASLPPFRQLTRAEFNPDSGTIEEVPTETHVWTEVENDFFERMEEFKERHEATLKRLEDERQRRIAAEAAAMQGIPKLNTKYEMKTPLPSFYERQQIAAERRHLPYDVRIEEYEAKYGKLR